jgi:hypothetical protein
MANRQPVTEGTAISRGRALPDRVSRTASDNGRSGANALLSFRRSPRSEETAWLSAGQLDPAERALRRSFKARRRELARRPGETMEAVTLRIARRPRRGRGER